MPGVVCGVEHPGNATTDDEAVRVYGLGFRVQGLGFRVQGLGFRF